MKAAGRRAKGNAFERQVATECREVWPAAQRGLRQTRDGAESADVEQTPYWIECKADERRPIERAVAQALAATDGRPIAVVSKRNRGELLVTMRLEDWLVRELALEGAKEFIREQRARAEAERVYQDKRRAARDEDLRTPRAP
jgi:hypothetical protein